MVHATTSNSTFPQGANQRGFSCLTLTHRQSEEVFLPQPHSPVGRTTQRHSLSPPTRLPQSAHVMFTSGTSQARTSRQDRIPWRPRLRIRAATRCGLGFLTSRLQDFHHPTAVGVFHSIQHFRGTSMRHWAMGRRSKYHTLAARRAAATARRRELRGLYRRNVSSAVHEALRYPYQMPQSLVWVISACHPSHCPQRQQARAGSHDVKLFGRHVVPMSHITTRTCTCLRVSIAQWRDQDGNPIHW